MRSYLITSPDHSDMVVFALSTTMAAEFSCVWHVLNGIEVTRYTIDPHWHRRLEGVERAHLKEALRLGIAGIGRYDPVGGWSFEMPRDEREDDRNSDQPIS
jgi:hypothetical protein